MLWLLRLSAAVKAAEEEEHSVLNLINNGIRNIYSSKKLDGVGPVDKRPSTA